MAEHKAWCTSVWWGVPPYYGQHTVGCNCPGCCGKDPSPDCDCQKPADLAAKKEPTDTCGECVRLQARIAELEATVKSIAFTVVSKPK